MLARIGLVLSFGLTGVVTGGLTGLLSLGCLQVTAQLGVPTHIGAGGPPVTVTAADVNGDGKVDLIVARSDQETGGGGAVTDSSQIRSTHGSLAVMLGHGDGSFTESFNTVGTGMETGFVSAVDINGDGRLDLVATGLLANGFVSVLYGRGDGTFNQPMSIVVGASAGSVKVGDVNGDGKADLVVLDKRPDPRFQGGKLVVLLGHGDGSFDAGRSLPIGRTPESFALADFNGDNRLDVAVADTRRVGVEMLIGNGDGTFENGGFLATEYAPIGVVGVDINKDGRIDMSVGSVQGTQIYLNAGGGSFQHVANYFDDYTRSAYFADFDNDGHLDFVTARRLFHGDGTGHFSPFALPQNEYDDSFVLAVDLNNDGFPDVVAADQAHNRLDVYLNRGGKLALRAAR